MNLYCKKTSLAFITVYSASIAFAGAGLDTIFTEGWEFEILNGFMSLVGIALFAAPVIFYGHILNFRRGKWFAFGITAAAGCLGNFNPELIKGSGWAQITMFIAIILMVIQSRQLGDEPGEAESDQSEQPAEKA